MRTAPRRPAGGAGKEATSEQSTPTLVEVYRMQLSVYLFQAAQPPEQCPSREARCVFVDATCYTPDCGGPESGNPDPRIAAG